MWREFAGRVSGLPQMRTTSGPLAKTAEVLSPQSLPPKPKRRRGKFWILFVALLIGVVAWITASGSPFAQAAREMAGWKHDQVILDKPFTVAPHTFRYYKFFLPEGSANVSIVGQFTTDAQKREDQESDNGIAVCVMNEAAFAMWQKGSATGWIYDSGIVPAGTMRADIPAGAGTYYLVFSNKASPKTAKTVHATVRLSYKNWLRRLLARHN